MEREFASKRDLIRAFADSMNLISPEDVQNGLLSDRLVTLLTEHYDYIDSIRNIESRAAGKVYQENLNI